MQLLWSCALEAHEAEELAKRKSEGKGWMTTSCCPAYLEIGNKLLPYLKEKRSDAKTPMGYTAEICKKEDPDNYTVFIGPCMNPSHACGRIS